MATVAPVASPLLMGNGMTTRVPHALLCCLPLCLVGCEAADYGVDPIAAEVISCDSMTPLADEAHVQGGACFVLTPSETGGGMRLDLQVEVGNYHLYVAPGEVLDFEPQDRVGVGSVTSGGRLRYIIPEPMTETVTVGVIPAYRANEDAEATIAVTADTASTTCYLYQCTATATVDELDTRNGDQVFVPLDVQKAGYLFSTVSWEGTTRLTSRIYGPDVGREGTIQTERARIDGESPLGTRYLLNSQRLSMEGPWSLGLETASALGGTISNAQIQVTYPRSR